MVYIDPPYGVGYRSKFQPFVQKRDPKDGKDADLTQEPEMIHAFRDTWELGIHSYLTYLRDRLLLARELLRDDGSCFVQINDQNLHHVREVMDEVFGEDNFVSLICFQTTSGFATRTLATLGDFLLWYGKAKVKMFVALLAKQLDVRPDGWEKIAGDFSEDGYRSIADVVDQDSLQKVREHKKSLKRRAAAK